MENIGTIYQRIDELLREGATIIENYWKVFGSQNDASENYVHSHVRPPYMLARHGERS